MTTIHHLTTADELFRTPGLGRCELLRGDLVMMSPSGSEHGYVIVNITAPLATFVKQHGLGKVFGAETGFRIGRDPDTVRAPDVAFVGAERAAMHAGRGFFPGPPDLAVEVVSPSDRVGDVAAKVQEWLDAGCRCVWVVDPLPQTVAVHRSREEVSVLDAGGQLSGEDLVPGFALAVSEIFA